MASSPKHLEGGDQRRVVDEAGEKLRVEMLLSEGITLADVQKLMGAGIVTCNGLMRQTKEDLIVTVQLPEDKVDEIIFAAQNVLVKGTAYREILIYKAIVAQKLEHYEEMAEAVHSIALLNTDLTRQERDLLLKCYEARISNALQSIRILKSMKLNETVNTSHLKVINDFTEISENLLEKICADAIEVANKHLLPFSVESETKGLYHKIIGDCSFLICEHKTRTLNHLKDIGLSAYEAGFYNMSDGGICPSNPTRIALVINLSAAYHVLGFTARAFEFATEELKAATCVRESMSDEAKQMVDLLSENLERWIQNGKSPAEQDGDNHGTEMRYELRSLLVHTEQLQDHQDGFFPSQYITQPPTPSMIMHNSLGMAHLSLEREFLPGCTDTQGNQASLVQSGLAIQEDIQQVNEGDQLNGDDVQQVDDAHQVDDAQEVNEADPLDDVQQVNEDDHLNADDGGEPLVFHQVERAPRLTFEEPPSWDDSAGNSLGGKKFRRQMKKNNIDRSRWG